MARDSPGVDVPIISVCGTVKGPAVPAAHDLADSQTWPCGFDFLSPACYPTAALR